MPQQWDENGNPIKAAPTPTRWDEKGNPILTLSAELPTHEQVAAGYAQRKAVATTPEPETEGFGTGLLGPLAHPIDLAKSIWASGEKAYQDIKDHPLKTMLVAAGHGLRTGMELANIPVNAPQDIAAVQQEQRENPNVGSYGFQMAQAMNPASKYFLPLGDVATSAARGQTSKAVGQGTNLALSLIAMLPEEKVLSGAPAITRGIAPGASKTAEWLESRLTKFPSGNALEQAYSHNQTLLRATMANAVADAANQSLPKQLFKTVEENGRFFAVPKEAEAEGAIEQAVRGAPRGEVPLTEEQTSGQAARRETAEAEARLPKSLGGKAVPFDPAQELLNRAAPGGHVIGARYTDEGLRSTFLIPESKSLSDLIKDGAIIKNADGSYTVAEKRMLSTKPPTAPAVKIEVDAAGKPILNLNPDEIVGNFERGATTLRQGARASYREADKFVDANQKEIVKSLVKAVPQQEAGFYESVFTHPIEGMKISIAKLNQQGERMMNAGRGLEAHPIFEQANHLTEILNDVKSKLPPEIQQRIADGDRLWMNKSALEDIADVLKDPSIVHGPPPSAQSSLTKIKPQVIAGEKMLREATMGDKAARFQQVFGPETTRQITDLADIIGKQQALKGAGTQGIGGMMLGSGMLLGAMRGTLASLTPLVGLDLMARAMASPNNWSLVKGLFTANQRVASMMIAPRIIRNLRQEGKLPTYLHEELPPQQAGAQQAQPQPATTGATIGEQLKSKGITVPMAPPNIPSLPFHPGAGLNQ